MSEERMTIEYQSNHVGAPLRHPIVTEFQLRNTNELQAREIARLKQRCSRLLALCSLLATLAILLGLVVIDGYLGRLAHCLLFVWAGVLITVAMQLFARKMLAPKDGGVIEMEDML